MALTSRGLRIEVVGREVTGRPVPGRPRRPYSPLLLGLPALLLLSILVVPIGITSATAFGNGLGNFEVLADPDALHAIRNSLIWVGIAVALIVVGFGLALASYRLPTLLSILQPALLVPFAVSALVSGATFRIMFDPAPERGTMSAAFTTVFGSSPVWLGPGLFWLVLASAFGWIWLGYVVSLFRTGLDAIPADLARTVRVEGLRGWRRLVAVELPILRPISGIITLTLVVASVRIFDLVLIGVPASMHHDADVLALQWWRIPSGPGPAAALGLVLFVAVAAVALTGMRGLRRTWAMPASNGARRQLAQPDRRGRLFGWSVGFLISLVWVFPALVLVATALHSPREAGLRGWWSLDAIGFDSFTAASNAGLWRSLASTFLIAVVATVVLLLVAVPTAYLIAWGGLPRRVGRVSVTVLVILAVAPVQMYAAPLRDAFVAAGLGGSRMSLALVHAAAGLPFGVLLLRSAFASARPSLIAEALQGHDRQSTVITAVRDTYRPALIAVAVLEFVLVWNDFIVGFLIGGPASTPLSLVLWGEARQFATSAGTVAAAAVVSSIVPVALLLAFWPAVVRGLTVGTRP